MKTFTKILQAREWIAHIDDERDIDNSIIVTLKEGWFFEDEQNCGVRGFDTVKEVQDGTRISQVINKNK